MLAALRKGKVSRSVDGYEDLMTSVVFGVLQRTPIQHGLLPVLSAVQGAPAGWLTGVTQIDTEFWPWWNASSERSGAEPDVVLTLNGPGGLRLLIIEAKRKSGKSGHGERDQLARQVANGREIAHERGAELLGLVYLTTHLTWPQGDLADSKRELGDDPTPLMWLSWRDVTPKLFQAAEDLPRGPMKHFIRDAGECMRRWGMQRFQGWPDVLPTPGFQFTRSLAMPSIKALPPWTFNASET